MCTWSALFNVSACVSLPQKSLWYEGVQCPFVSRLTPFSSFSLLAVTIQETRDLFCSSPSPSLIATHSLSSSIHTTPHVHYLFRVHRNSTLSLFFSLVHGCSSILVVTVPVSVLAIQSGNTCVPYRYFATLKDGRKQDCSWKSTIQWIIAQIVMLNTYMKDNDVDSWFPGYVPVSIGQKSLSILPQNPFSSLMHVTHSISCTLSARVSPWSVLSR